MCWSHNWTGLQPRCSQVTVSSIVQIVPLSCLLPDLLNSPETFPTDTSSVFCFWSHGRFCLMARTPATEQNAVDKIPGKKQKGKIGDSVNARTASDCDGSQPSSSVWHFSVFKSPPPPA